MDAFQDVIKEDLLGEAPSPTLIDLYRLKIVEDYKSPQDTALAVVPQQGPEHVVRQARRKNPLHNEVVHTLRTAARQVPFSMDGCKWPFLWETARAAMFSNSAAWIENHFLPKLTKEVVTKKPAADDLVYVHYLESQAHYRIYLEHGTQESRAQHFQKAVDSNKRLAAAASKAGTSVPAIFSSIAAVNDVGYDWEMMRITNPAAPRMPVVDLCERGMKVCQEASAKFNRWMDVRRDRVEYAALRAYLLQTEAAKAAAALQDLDRALVQFCAIHEKAILGDVLLLLRPNMEPAAQRMIKHSKVYQRLVREFPGTKTAAEMMPAGTPPARLTPALLREIEKIAEPKGDEK